MPVPQSCHTYTGTGGDVNAVEDGAVGVVLSGGADYGERSVGSGERERDQEGQRG